MKRQAYKRRNIIELVILLIIIVLINYIGSFLFARIDLTSDKRYTLKPESEQILRKLDDIVYVKIYLEGENLTPPYKKLQRAIKEMLDEFRVQNENIEYEFINPSESEDVKTRNEVFRQLYRKGLEPAPLVERDEEGGSYQNIVFPGLIINYNGNEAVINLQEGSGVSGAVINRYTLENAINNLEYNLIFNIYKLAEAKRSTVAFIEGHGELNQFQTADIAYELSKFYKPVRYRMTGHLDDYYNMRDFDVIIIAKPDSAFSNQDKYIIDQYVMDGGKVCWLIDAVEIEMDSLRSSSATLAMIKDLKLNDILFHYGVRVNPYIVQDLYCGKIPAPGYFVGKPNYEYVLAPWHYFPVIFPPAYSDAHLIVKNIDAIRTEFVNTIDTVGEDPAIEKSILLTTSDNSRVLFAPVRVSLDILKAKPDRRLFNKEDLPVAVLLEGKFTSVFKNRMPPAMEKLEDISGTKFKETSKPTKMIVAADGDIIKNYFHNGDISKPLPLGQDRFSKSTYYAGNKQFFINAINYLSDDEGIMAVRARDVKLRMLDKNKVKEKKLFWQMINTIVPIIIIIIFGIFINALRKQKYGIKK